MDNCNKVKTLTVTLRDSHLMQLSLTDVHKQVANLIVAGSSLDLNAAVHWLELFPNRAVVTWALVSNNAWAMTHGTLASMKLTQLYATDLQQNEICSY